MTAFQQKCPPLVGFERSREEDPATIGLPLMSGATCNCDEGIEDEHYSKVIGRETKYCL